MTTEKPLSKNMKEYNQGYEEGYHSAMIKKKEQVERLKENVKDNFIGDKPKLITVNNVLCYIDEIFGDLK